MRLSSAEVFDPGVQAERTALAWERTALAIAAGAATLGRMGAEQLGPGLAVLAFSSLAAASLVAGTARRRYVRMHCSLVAHGDLTGAPGGVRIAVLAFSTTVVGLLAAVFVVLR
ncbi:DUF202 domain-containing protein [Klenkia sp. PcliD-1-E]|uniref:DUF202 domain-containing protein n=1 Tax=Klenkia sp. PcliD-1-E TaxID=2954492 RepID=UPI0020977D44|nr:DUF202 domain-containing protein [Klenkia sp. PcliD-1-E]MCO7221125.1 DUF202 domain-containing protein [Klenkia sp. PcliD-1-E]